MTFQLRKTDKTERLAELGLFRDLSRRERSLIADAMVEEEVPSGRPLTREGQDGGTAYVIVEGKAEVSREGKSLASLGPNDVVGELSLLDQLPRTATVTATTDLKVLAIAHEDFAKVLESVPDLAHGLLSVLARRIRDLDSKVVSSL